VGRLEAGSFVRRALLCGLGLSVVVGAGGVGCAEAAPPLARTKSPAALPRLEPELAPVVEAPAASPCPRLEIAVPPFPAPEGGPPGLVDVPVAQPPEGSVMAPFYEALSQLERGRRARPVRIAVYGDSNLTMDFQTGEMRRVLQARYGDAGHGFVALGQPWSHYQHRDVRHGASAGYAAYAISTTPIGDGGYGLGGIAVENQWQGARTFVETAALGAPVGTHVSRFDVYFLRQESFGTFDAEVDGERAVRVDTAKGAERSLGRYQIVTDDAPHRLELVASSPARVRLFGVTLERGGPGVVVDSFGVGALNTRAMTKNDPELERAMLRERGYDLIVFMTGANDVFTMEDVPSGMRMLLELQREALPGVPIVLVTPADRGKEESFEPTLAVVEQRRQVAEDNGVASWDLWRAMGGRDSMSRFVSAKYARFDGIHFNEAGGALVGDLFVRALLSGLRDHLDAHPEAGCGALAGASAP
jgi:lysophospholipase L1-like esterase